MSYNILDVVRDIVSGELKFVPPETVSSRRTICHQCEIATLGVCTECGCLIETKIRLVKSDCPLGLWEKHEILDELLLV